MKPRLIILAAGEGRRLGGKVKTLVSFTGYGTALYGIADNLARHVEHVTVVAGYRRWQLFEAVPSVFGRFGLEAGVVLNDSWKSTNTAYSLALALESVMWACGVLVCNADLVFINPLKVGLVPSLDDQHTSWALCDPEVTEDEEAVLVRFEAIGGKTRVGVIGKIGTGDAEAVGLYYLSPTLCAAYLDTWRRMPRGERAKAYHEDVLNTLDPQRLNMEPWVLPGAAKVLEFDTPEDVERIEAELDGADYKNLL